MKKSLAELSSGESGEIIALDGGEGFKQRLKSRGLRQGVEISVLTRQPSGPLVIEAGRTQLTIGRGMARKIRVETPE